MTQLIDALRSKYRTPQAAMQALGIDEALLRDGAPMTLNSPLDRAAKAGLKELALAQDATLMDVMQFIDALKGTNPEGGEQQGAPSAARGMPPGGVPPEETDEEQDHEEPTEDGDMTATAPNGGLPMVGGGKRNAYDNDAPMGAPGAGEIATDNPAAKLHSLLAQHCPPEVMAEIGEILGQIAGEADAGEADVNAAEATEDEQPGEVKKEEEKKEMKAAMDAAFDEFRKSERANSQAIIDALRVVRPVVGELAMAFDSADGVFRQALKMRGVDAAKVKDPEALRLLWSNLPKPSVSAPRQQSFAMDAASIDSYHKLFPSAARIGRV